MKTLIAILIVFSFLQSTVTSLDLVLIVLICRAFIKEEEENLYLAFSVGLFVSFLRNEPLGYQSIFYILTIFSTHLISKSRFAKRIFLIVPLSAIFLSLNNVTNSLILSQSINLFPKVVIESILCIPAFFILRVWEERFIPKKEIRLRI